MTSPAVELQDAVLARLQADADVVALLGDRIYDGAPTGADFPHLEFGPSDFVPDDDAGDLRGRIEVLQLDVWARHDGRLWQCRQINDAVCKALHRVDLDLATHALLVIEARARVQRDPDGITAHGIITIEANIEEVTGG